MVSLPQDRDFKEYPQAAAKPPFVSVSGKFLVFSGLTWTAYLHFGGKNIASAHLSEMTKFRTRNDSI